MYDDALLTGEAKGKVEGKIEGRIEGEKDGERKTAIKHAKSMLIKDISEELIAEITGLTPEEIRILRLETETWGSKN